MTKSAIFIPFLLVAVSATDPSSETAASNELSAADYTDTDDQARSLRGGPGNQFWNRNYRSDTDTDTDDQARSLFCGRCI